MLARLKFDIDPVVVEMLKYIPDDIIVNGTFFDPAIGGGQFVKEIERRKRAAGKTDKEIADTVHGVESNSLRLAYAVNKHHLVGTYTVGDFLTQDINMKFDVLIGNPPFQHNSKSKGNKLWPKFIYKGYQLLKDSGHLAMITPSGWAAGGNNMPGGIGIIKDVFAPNNLIIANLSDMSQHFPKVGVSFSWFVMQKTDQYRITQIDIDGNTFYVDFRNLEFIPDDITTVSLSIFQKLFNNKKRFKVLGYDRQKDDNKSTTPTATNGVKHWVLGTGNTIQYTYLPYDKSPDISGIRKVVFPLRKFSNVPMIHIDDQGLPVCQQGFYVEIDNYDVSNVSSIWNSKLFRFMTYSIHPTGFLKTNIIKSLPFVDMSRTWTDQELFDHFSLTDEEIEYIEKAVA
jgi:hypothetical protein